MELAAEVALAPMSKASLILRRFLQAENLPVPAEQPDKNAASTNDKRNEIRKHFRPTKRTRTPSASTDSDSEGDPNEHMHNPHKRVVNMHISNADIHLSGATSDQWAAVYHQLCKQRGFTREYNDKQKRRAARGRKATLCKSTQHVPQDKSIHVQGTEYIFSHDSTTHAPTGTVSQWTSVPLDKPTRNGRNQPTRNGRDSLPTQQTRRPFKALSAQAIGVAHRFQKTCHPPQLLQHRYYNARCGVCTPCCPKNVPS